MIEAPVVFLVDDDASMLRSLTRLLKASGYQVAPFASAAQLLSVLKPVHRGCVVSDMQMPGLSGLELQAALGKAGNPLPVIFLTGHGDIPTTVNAMRQGAEDFLTKPVKQEELLPAVERALARDAAAWQQTAFRRELQARLDLLTPREHEVLTHVVGGKLNKQIAGDLGTTERTIKAHRASIMEKLRAQSPADLGRLAQLAGIGG